MDEGISIHLRRGLIMLALMTLLTGGIYPLTMTLLGRGLFPSQAAGSLLSINGQVLGSALLGQPFTAPQYFRGRPSSAGEGYDAARSSGSNLGPINPALLESVAERARAAQTQNGTSQPVPVDLVTASGSGLDPHISPAAAQFQIPRVARARGMDEQSLMLLVRQHVEGRTFGFLGEPVVNVLKLNLALDGQRVEQ